MKIIATLFIIFLFNGSIFAQSQDTIFVNEWKMADSLYGELGALIPTGYLMNRTLMDTTVLFAYNAHKTDQYTPNADYFYRLMYEMKLMALDSSQVPGLLELYYSSSSYVAEQMFDDDRYIYPIGVADFRYNRLDEEFGIQNGLLIKNGLSYNDTDTSNTSAYSEYRVQLTAPLFDNHSSPNMGLVFKSEHFFSNHKDTNDVNFLEVYIDSNWWMVGFNEIIDFVPTNEEIQSLKLRVTYSNGEQFENDIFINTPEQVLGNSIIPKGDNICNEVSEYTEGVIRKLVACRINGCADSNHPPHGKTYILVTGYRPPIFGQSFDKTWSIYNTHHQHLLQHQLDNGYDVYLIKFNIHNTPQSHGMIESAKLFVKFLKDLNANKEDKYGENVIHASSMGADIVNLALLIMENDHFQDNNYPHHHSRLFIAYDGNFYGANIPLAYQYQIYSGFKQPAQNPVFPLSANPSLETTFLRVYLYATMEQKTVKELLMYHAQGNNLQLFDNNEEHLKITPTHHPFRQTFLNELAIYDSGNHFIPIPNATRNVSISLGKISGPNNWSNTSNVQFKDPGEYWLDFTVSPYISKIRSAVYTSDYVDLFRRKKLGVTLLPLSLNVDHKVEVKHMQEIDVAAGSYLEGLGNVISIASRAYLDGTTPFHPNTAKQYFSHKAVLTALAINKNLWPTDGSMNLNMQSLGLMYNNRTPSGILLLSDHYGYPNLGRPNDHFDITPFEAIYVDHTIDPHIDLKDRDQADLAELNGFIFNEVEPWYLGLQNQNLGAQARSNYIYKSRRSALHGITVGYNVTPTTDLGDYNVKPNADLILHAGEYIDLFPGTTFEEGCKGTLILGYSVCGPLFGKSIENNNETTPHNAISTLEKTETTTDRFGVKVFPNPNNGSFSIESTTKNPISSYKIYNFSGTLVVEESIVNTQRLVLNRRLEKGTYIVVVTIDGVTVREKLIIL